MTQAGGKKGSKDTDETQESCPSWVNGIKCALNVQLRAPDYTPSVFPPVANYLQEVALGMTGGAGDPAAQNAVNAARRVGTKPTAVQRMKALMPVLKGEAAASACTSIFWLVLAGIFGHLSEESLTGFRSILGETYYSMTLQTLTQLTGDKDLQDSVLSALPYAFAQAVYRMLVDGFVEDRALYIKQGDKLLLKTCQIAYFELAGFQVTSETVRRARHRLFLRRVVCSPHVDQQEFIKGKKRQEMLESHSAGQQDAPLEFGKDTGNPLEESQLDHVMFGSDLNRRKVQKMVNAGKQAWEMETTPVPEELSVARYSELKSGAAMHERQLTELRSLLEEDTLAEEDDEFETERPDSACSSPMGSEPPSPALSMPGSPHTTMRAKSWQSAGTPGGTFSPTTTNFGFGYDDSPPGTAGEVGENFETGQGNMDGTDRHKRMWRKGVNVARFMEAKEDARTRKEQEVKAKKLRQETVAKKICAEELPPDLCVRTLSTSWVSPPFQYLAHAPDRHQVLHKTSLDTFKLTMAVKGELPKRPLSMPAPQKSKSQLRRRNLESQLGAGAAVSGSRGGEDSSLGSVRGGAGAGLLPSSQSVPMLPRMVVTASLGSKASSTSKGDTAAASSSAANLPRMAAIAGALAAGSNKAVSALMRGEVLNMDPPQRLKQDLVLQRMEEHGKAYVKNSFALYTKEHDIFTGTRKNRSDPTMLKNEEDAYIKKMEMLVGGDPKRLIAPEGVGKH